METAKQQDTKIVEIGRYEKSLLGEETTYMFVLMQGGGAKQYGIAILRGEEEKRCSVSDDLFSAAAFFEKVVRGDVFPYSLGELLEDYRAAQKNSERECAQNPLQIS